VLLLLLLGMGILKGKGLLAQMVACAFGHSKEKI
jgi:hypothetical protein